MKSLLDPTFRYRNSLQTDLRKTFARVRREMARAAGERKPPDVIYLPAPKAAKR